MTLPGPPMPSHLDPSSHNSSSSSQIPTSSDRYSDFRDSGSGTNKKQRMLPTHSSHGYTHPRESSDDPNPSTANVGGFIFPSSGLGPSPRSQQYIGAFLGGTPPPMLHPQGPPPFNISGGFDAEAFARERSINNNSGNGSSLNNKNFDPALYQQLIQPRNPTGNSQHQATAEDLFGFLGAAAASAEEGRGGSREGGGGYAMDWPVHAGGGQYFLLVFSLSVITHAPIPPGAPNPNPPPNASANGGIPNATEWLDFLSGNNPPGGPTSNIPSNNNNTSAVGRSLTESWERGTRTDTPSSSASPVVERARVAGGGGTASASGSDNGKRAGEEGKEGKGGAASNGKAEEDGGDVKAKMDVG